jgi:hypothetical protein
MMGLECTAVLLLAFVGAGVHDEKLVCIARGLIGFEKDD